MGVPGILLLCIRDQQMELLACRYLKTPSAKETGFGVYGFMAFGEWHEP